MKRIFYACLLMAIGCMALETMPLDKLDKPSRWKANGGVTVEAADGVNGQAGVVISHLPKGTAQLQLAFDDDQLDVFDQYQGVSFYVKGDGSDCWETISLLHNYNYTYNYFVPLKSTEWVKYTVAWCDFIPEGQCGMIQQSGGIPACGINTLRIGCRWKIWYDNAQIPEHTLMISDVKLEPVVNRPANTWKPAPFEGVLAKLRNKEPLTIQFQGDSITAGTSLANKVAERYSIKTEELLRKWLKNDKINCVNRAVGGARTNDERAWLQRDFNGGVPDLVTLWIGYNDKSGCNTVGYYKQTVADYIDRVAEITKGRSAFLLFAPGPGKGPRFTMMDDYAQAIRELAAERGLPCFDVSKLFKAFGKKEFANTYMADMAHPNAKGHQVVADALCEFLVKAAGITESKPLPPPEPVVENHTSLTWDFEGPMDNWILELNAGPTDEKAKDGKRCMKLLCAKGEKDHTRAWSQPIPVKAWQKFTVSGDLLVDLEHDEGIGVYVVEYMDDEAKGAYRNPLTCVGRKSMPNWSHFSSEYKVPEGVKAIRLLFWSFKTNVGSVYLDNLSLQPR
ncbi:MAG: SGNH/GDSL hydrolase family protein [Victivallales bacterium]|nr:SGNH/GDSL hydrolase family protein [Victivallales bacterium]